MTQRVVRCLLGALGLAPFWVGAAEAPAEDPRWVDSQITEVTVYADRAAVTRAATVDLADGTARYAFPKLPAWIDEGSVRLSVSPAGAGELLDVEVLKTFLARPDDEEVRKAEIALQEMTDRTSALEDERGGLEAQSQQLESIRAFVADKAPKDAAVREVKVDEYAAVVRFVGETHLQLARAKRELERKKRELQPELSLRQRQLDELRQRAQLEQRTVVATVVSRSAKSARLTLAYLLPGATWEPVHELRAAPDGAQVTLASFGIVTQTTSEDWNGVKLALSTQRPTEMIRIPELEALFVGGSRALGRVLQRGAETFRVSAGAFDQQFGLWNATNNDFAGQAELARNLRRQEAVQKKVAQLFQDLQLQRGTTAHFAGTGSQTVRTDGRPVRVLTGGVQLAARPRIVAAPEVSLNAVRIADLVNTGPSPLLPGKVLLYSEGTFLGTTDTEFVAQGEEFAVFLGVADQIKLSRMLDRKSSSLSWGGKRNRLQVKYLITVENLTENETSLQLSDRVPVSETGEVKVSGIRLSPKTKPDSKGLVKWELTLGARQKVEVRLEYTLDYPAGLAQRPAPAKAGRAAAVPAVRLQQDVLNLERALE